MKKVLLLFLVLNAIKGISQISPESSKGRHRKFDFDSIPIKVTGTIDGGALFGLPSRYTSKYTLPPTGNLYISKYPYNGNGILANNFLELRIAIDRMISRKLSVGGGFNFDISGTDMLIGNKTPISFMLPAYLNIKYSILKRRLSPFISGQLGGTFYAGNCLGGGGIGAIQLGLRAYVSQKATVNLSIGYRVQHLAFKGHIGNSKTDTSTPTTINTISQFLSFHLGGTF